MVELSSETSSVPIQLGVKADGRPQGPPQPVRKLKISVRLNTQLAAFATVGATFVVQVPMLGEQAEIMSELIAPVLLEASTIWLGFVKLNVMDAPERGAVQLTEQVAPELP